MDNKTNAEKVKEFMQTFHQEVKEKPGNPGRDISDLRFELIQEEVEELEVALDDYDIDRTKEDFVKIADALTDILYVVYGAAHSFGIPIDECFQEVHRSNMTKADKDGNPIYRSDGKIMKSDRYEAPNLEQFIEHE